MSPETTRNWTTEEKAPHWSCSYHQDMAAKQEVAERERKFVLTLLSHPPCSFGCFSLLEGSLHKTSSRRAQGRQSAGLHLLLELWEQMEANRHKDSSSDSWFVCKRRSTVREISSEWVHKPVTVWWIISACLLSAQVLPMDEIQFLFSQRFHPSRSSRQIDPAEG